MMASAWKDMYCKKRPLVSFGSPPKRVRALGYLPLTRRPKQSINKKMSCQKAPFLAGIATMITGPRMGYTGVLAWRGWV